MMLRVDTKRDVLIWSAAVTALAVTVPVVAMLPFALALPTRFLVQVMAPTVAIPVLIAAPISIFAFHLLRLMTATINQVDRLVKFDPMTGLMSRNYFLESAQGRISEGGCVMIVDADFFKRINDTYGHEVGDEALKIIARGLVQGSGPSAIVGRLGGEEFGVCLPPPVDADLAATFANRINEAVRELGSAIGDIRIGLTVSIGVKVAAPGESFQSAMKEADILLYEAKRAGRDRFVIAVGSPGGKDEARG